jgi:hypothetical protein
MIFGKSTNSQTCTGSAASACYQQGAKYANGEFIQVHPTSIPGEDQTELESESARGEGGRVWVPNISDKRAAKIFPTNERWYFLGRKISGLRQSCARDIATREIFQVCLDGYGRGRRKSGLSRFDAVPAETLTRKIRRDSGNLRNVRRRRPALCADANFSPGVHYSMGGLWVDFEQANEYSRICLRRANAIIRFTARIVWARIRWFPVFTADSSPRRRRLITRKTSSAETRKQTAFTSGTETSAGNQRQFNQADGNGKSISNSTKEMASG